MRDTEFKFTTLLRKKYYRGLKAVNVTNIRLHTQTICNKYIPINIKCIVSWMYFQIAMSSSSFAQEVTGLIRVKAIPKYLYNHEEHMDNIYLDFAYPILKHFMEYRNLTCTLCFKSFVNNTFSFDNATAAKAAAKEFNARLWKNDVDYLTMYKEQFYQLRNQLDELKAMGLASLENLGSAMAMSKPNYASKFSNTVLRNLMGQDVNMTMWQLVRTLAANFDQMFEHEMDYLDIGDSMSSYFLDLPINQQTLTAILRIMKDNIGQPHFFDLNFLSKEKFTGDLGQIQASYPSWLNKKLTGYDLKTLRKDDFLGIAIKHPFMPYCQWIDKMSNTPIWGSNGQSKEKSFKHFCTLFRPTFTDQGICYTFNGKSDSYLMRQDTDYMKAYKEIFGLPEKDFQGPESNKASGIGIQNGLRIVLDAHTLSGRSKYLAKTDNTFQIAIHHPNDFALPLTQGFKIRGGMKTRSKSITN